MSKPAAEKTSATGEEDTLSILQSATSDKH